MVKMEVLHYVYLTIKNLFKVKKKPTKKIPIL